MDSAAQYRGGARHDGGGADRHGQPGDPPFSVRAGGGRLRPADHWTQDDAAGGGRIVGEACHFIDLLRHLAGAPITSLEVTRIDEPGDRPDDKATITLGFADGSIGTVHYFANGNKAVSKERLEVFAGGRIYQLDNYRRLTAHGDPKLGTVRSLKVDKGQDAFAASFLRAVAGQAPPPIPAEELFEVSRASILAADLARGGAPAPA